MGAVVSVGLTQAERATIRQRASAALANLGEFRLYWVPKHRCITARSLSVRRRFRIPRGAVEVGLYSSAGSRARDILDDLSELLARLTQARPGEPPAG
jgi:hypothetical protein